MYRFMKISRQEKRDHVHNKPEDKKCDFSYWIRLNCIFIHISVLRSQFYSKRWKSLNPNSRLSANPLFVFLHFMFTLPQGCWLFCPVTTSGHHTLSLTAGSLSGQPCSAQPWEKKEQCWYESKRLETVTPHKHPISWHTCIIRTTIHVSIV